VQRHLDVGALHRHRPLARGLVEDIGEGSEKVAASAPSAGAEKSKPWNETSASICCAGARVSPRS
jgi:hypothetical protein